MSQPAPVFNSSHVDEDTVLNRLMSLKANKAIGLDPISASAICSSVASLLNLSISSGKYPDVWKCSKVRALFSNLTNYCPISVLPTISKIMEKVDHFQFYDFLNSYYLLTSINTKGFVSSIQLLQLWQIFRTNTTIYVARESFCAVFLDLTKAFDNVGHCTLSPKLSEIGAFLSSKWFEFYLNNRKQKTSCSNEISAVHPVTVN